MKTRIATTILTSAYLSAMLASSVAPMRTNATFAAAVDPSAAEKALQNAISGLDAAGWAAAASGAAPSAAPEPKIVLAGDPQSKSEPVMNDELWARLVKFVRSLPEPGSVDARICKVLDLCDGTKAMPMKLGESEAPVEGNHFIGIPLDPNSKDILLFVIHKGGTPVDAYLTDKSRTLRAAAVSQNGVARLITNEKAAAKFKAEMDMWAGEALTLPPTNAPAPGNS